MSTDYYKIQDKNAEKTVIVFSSIHTLPGKFRFERQFANLDINVIFLNCPNNSWYLQGVPGLGDSLSTTRDAIKNIIDTTFPDSKVFALGSSMGASGLIGITSGLNIERAFAFCPEIDLFKKYSFSANYYKGAITKQRDLWSELRECKNLHIFYGEECESDLNQLCSLKIQTDIPLQTFAHEGHGTIEAIFLTEGLDGILDSLLNYRPVMPKIIQRGHIPGSLVTCKTLWRSYFCSRPDTKSDVLIMEVRESLADLANKTKPDRSYYPLIQYWRAILEPKKSEKLELLECAMASAPHSLRIASAYFKIHGEDSVKLAFKQKFREKYGDRYTDHSRADLIRIF
ncbi:UNVERIFIED_ORG: hypothetical protein J2W82_002550 [Pseudomonas mohnii]|nr:hypothetical protein [Pseudomonas mohnii]